MDNEKPKRKNKLGAGRPFKMKIWVEALAKVIEERKIAFLNNEELVFLVNKEIPDKDHQITSRTFKNWIAGKTDPKDKELADEFSDLYRSALIEQKLNIINDLMAGGDKNWYRLGWLLERKFSDEFNLKKITEVQHTSNQPIIQIQAANSQQMQLIDSIINDNVIDADFTVIEPIRLPAVNDNEKEDDYDF
jgi:hypothetical protein